MTLVDPCLVIGLPQCMHASIWHRCGDIAPQR